MTTLPAPAAAAAPRTPYPPRRPGGRRLTRAGLAVSAAAAALLPGTAYALTAAPAAAGPPDAVVRWNETVSRAATAACLAPLGNPLHESRMYAITALSEHDALNAIDRRSAPYAYRGRARPGALPRAAVVAAAHRALTTTVRGLTDVVSPECLRKGLAVVEREYAQELGNIPAGLDKRRGIQVGEAAAAAVLSRRAHDGSDTPLVDADYPQGTKPGQWRFTPEVTFAFAPGWGTVTPFALTSASQVRPDAPYSLTSAAYTADLRDVQRLGGGGSTASARTPDQTQIARFWWESSPQMWNRVGRTLARTERLDLWQSARLFGLLDMALADGYISSFDAKFSLRFWRPVTAIRLAASDGNPDTAGDPDWTPLEVTPPIPDHDSAHAVEGGAATAVFRQFFGTDHKSFSTCSMTLPSAGEVCGQPGTVHRTFGSFTAAATENSMSRVYIGFHFRHAVQSGQEHGRRIGDIVVRDHLQPG